MEQNGMTARVSAFARAWHTAQDGIKVFDDPLAARLLTAQEYEQIAAAMTQGAAFFDPSLADGGERALDAVMRGTLAATPLGRAAFAEDALRQAVSNGASQYMLCGAGLDSFACRRPAWALTLRVIELDLPAASADKQARLRRAGLSVHDTTFLPCDLTEPAWPARLARHPAFHTEAVTFCSLLGLSYYLSEAALGKMLTALRGLLPAGSALALDYPVREGQNKISRLAAAAGEQMQASYTPQRMQALLTAHGWQMIEQLAPEEIERRYFAAYNTAWPERRITPPRDVWYCLAAAR